jgi:hypothetical protein
LANTSAMQISSSGRAKVGNGDRVVSASAIPAN